MEGQIEGRMERRWAEQYSDEGFYYSSKPGTCQNPHCGHDPIFHRHILRHNISGEVVEVGTHCYQRWRICLGLSTAAWFDDYIELLMEVSMKHEDRRISPSEMKGLQEETIIRMVSKGKLKPENIPPGVDKELQRKARKEYILKYCKEHGFHLELIHQPLQNFVTFDEAEEWAMERGGYCGQTQTIGKEKFWFTYVNPHYEKGQY